MKSCTHAMRFLIAIVVLNECVSENHDVSHFSCTIKTLKAASISPKSSALGRNRMFDKATKALQDSIYKITLNT